MNRKIALKSVLAVAMVGFVLVSASCKKEDPKKEDPKPKPEEKVHQIVGTWNYETVSLKDVVCDDPATKVAMFYMFENFEMASNIETILGGTYEFTADGKTTHKINDETEKGSYVVDGSKLTITYAEDNVSATFNLSFADKAMYWEFDIFDMTEILAKHGYEPYLDLLSDYEVTKAVLKITLKKQ